MPHASAHVSLSLGNCTTIALKAPRGKKKKIEEEKKKQDDLLAGRWREAVTRLARMLLAAWEDGRTSLRRPLDVTATA